MLFLKNGSFHIVLHQKTQVIFYIDEHDQKKSIQYLWNNTSYF